jgi:hypothetical protein
VISSSRRRERQHAFIGRRENRVEQIVFVIALVDIDADQGVAPTRGGWKRKHVIGLDQPVTHAVRGRKVGTAIVERTGGGFREHGRAIRRQLPERDVPVVVPKPLMSVAAGAGNLEPTVDILEQDDVVGEPPKAPEHDIFIGRQLLARTQGRLPLALQDRDIIEHLR